MTAWRSGTAPARSWKSHCFPTAEQLPAMQSPSARKLSAPARSSRSQPSRNARPHSRRIHATSRSSSTPPSVKSRHLPFGIWEAEFGLSVSGRLAGHRNNRATGSERYQERHTEVPADQTGRMWLSDPNNMFPHLYLTLVDQFDQKLSFAAALEGRLRRADRRGRPNWEINALCWLRLASRLIALRLLRVVCFGPVF
jgi:hypothetical protein